MKDQQTTSIWKRQFLPELSITRLFRWLFSWRMMRRYIFFLVCLVTLVALFYAEENWRGKYEWQKYQRQLTASGVNLDWKRLIPPKVPDESNFAMTPFLAPLYDYDFNPDRLQPGQLRWRDTNGYAKVSLFGADINLDFPKWREGKMTDLQRAMLNPTNKLALKEQVPAMERSEAARRLLQFLEKDKSVFDELVAASHRPYSRFNIDYDNKNPAAILLPHLATINRLGKIFRLRASGELALKQTDAAEADLNFMFFLADSIHKEPIVISQLVRRNVLGDAQQIIWEGLANHNWSNEQLQRFEARLQQLDLFKEFELPLEAERSAFGNQLFDLFRDHREEMVATLDESGLDGMSGVGRAYYWAPKGWLYLEQISYQRAYQELIMPGLRLEGGHVNVQKANAIGEELNKMLNQPIAASFWKHHAVVSKIVPAFNRSIQNTAFAQNGVNLTSAACALERYRLAHGQFPDMLDQLVPQFVKTIPVDIISGKPLKYQRKEDGSFLLYSIGWNEKDDGGTVVSGGTVETNKDGKSEDVTQGDWVWPQYREQ
jgi:hypothetical protein